jgi:hypothetical protein
MLHIYHTFKNITTYRYSQNRYLIYVSQSNGRKSSRRHHNMHMISFCRTKRIIYLYRLSNMRTGKD